MVIISMGRERFEQESLDHLEEFGSAIGSTDMRLRLLLLLIARLLDKFFSINFEFRNDEMRLQIIVIKNLFEDRMRRI